MIEVIHITQKRNIESIMEKGLITTPPLLHHHEDKARIDFDNYNENGLIYTIQADTNRLDKYIRDTIYWDTWGKPRNKHLGIFDTDKEWNEGLNIGTKIFKNLRIKPENYYILLLNIEEYIERVYWKHSQTNNMSEYWLDMQSEYEHHNKPLVILNRNLDRNYISIVGTAETYIKRNHIIGTRLNI